jgi:hypothetical protein
VAGDGVGLGQCSSRRREVWWLLCGCLFTPSCFYCPPPRVELSGGCVHEVVRAFLLHYGYADTLTAFDQAAGSAGLAQPMRCGATTGLVDPPLTRLVDRAELSGGAWMTGEGWLGFGVLHCLTPFQRPLPGLCCARLQHRRPRQLDAAPAQRRAALPAGRCALPPPPAASHHALPALPPALLPLPPPPACWGAAGSCPGRQSSPLYLSQLLAGPSEACVPGCRRRGWCGRAGAGAAAGAAGGAGAPGAGGAVPPGVPEVHRAGQVGGGVCWRGASSTSWRMTHAG